MKRLALLLLLGAASAMAAVKSGDIITVHLADGTAYEGAKVMDLSPSALILFHQKSVLTVELRSLDADSQRLVGYDPDADAEHRAKQAVSDAKAAKDREARDAEAMAKAKRDLAIRTAQERNAANQIDASLEVIQVTEDGILAKGLGRIGPPGTVSVVVTKYVQGTALDNYKLVPREVTEQQDPRPLVSFGDRVFVYCDTAGLIDGDNVSARIWSAGTYAYTTAMGARATVKAYTTKAPYSPADFMPRSPAAK